MSHWASQIMEPGLKGDALIIGSPLPHPVPSSPYNHQPWWWACVPPVFSLGRALHRFRRSGKGSGLGKTWEKTHINHTGHDPSALSAGSLPAAVEMAMYTFRGAIHSADITACSIISTQFSSAIQLCLTLCNPMDCSTPGFPVHHQLLQLAQTHVQVGDAIQPSHPLSPPSPPAFNLSQHQGLFKWVSSLHQVAKVLEFQLQHQSFQWIFRTDFL